ncbi:MAG: hypothetical protein MUQ10_00590 [Anaerolineae bacterium]|nr:hypothetical protein [Anaerolineae bacterium]
MAQHHAAPVDQGERRRLRTFVFEYDSLRRHLMENRGDEKPSDAGVIRRMRFGNWSLPQVILPGGYVLRSTQRVVDVINAGFNRATHTGKEPCRLTTMSPSFRHDLDLAGWLEEGSFGSCVGVTNDEVDRHGILGRPARTPTIGAIAWRL